MPNRLATQSSPYLLEHADNPVEWYPWGSEALERANREDKPIFLSIGYSACHWCHVMARESFADPQTAALLNEHFVPIKVDREERPDLDQVYMAAVQAMTGRGGWPMSVFLTPDQKPFYGGTYWPPAPRYGMPSFSQVLSAVADAWQNRRAEAIEQANSMVAHLQTTAAPRLAAAHVDASLIPDAARSILEAFDSRLGGFSGAPKFPHPMDMRLLLRAWRRQRNADTLHAVAFTLERMAAGGIYDQLGGGFHRYSVDDRWLVPHFEKMLYDNALLTLCLVETFQVTGNELFARVARETCDYVLREMTVEGGGFASTQDADSEGEEGKFFVWTPPEIAAILGPAAETFCKVYDVTPQGNFEHGKSILNLPRSLEEHAKLLSRDVADLERELAASRAVLLEAREGRVHPHRDDKVLVAWNGLMIDALAMAAGALGEPKYLAAAQRAAEFLLTNLRAKEGRLLHTWRQGQARLDGYLDDYACLINGLVSLYEADFNERWITEAVLLAGDLLARFYDDEQGGFFFTASDHEQLISRHKDLFDNAVPSGSGMAALALERLGSLTSRDDFIAAAEKTLQSAATLLSQAPRAVAQMLLALDFQIGPSPQIVLLGDAARDPTAEALRNLRGRFLPNKVVACRTGKAAPAASPLDALFAGKSLCGNEPTVFLCEHHTCQAPVHGRDAALATWERLSSIH